MKLLPALLLFPLALTLGAVEPSLDIPVWPEGVQGPVNDTPPERVLPPLPAGKRVLRLEGVTAPSLMLFPAPKATANGTSIIICPGGGFGKLALDLEGTEIAENLNAAGITAFVLKYRTTPAGKADPQLGPTMDVQQSIALVRSRAAEFGLKADRIGLLGISAGGQAAVIAATNHAQPLYEAMGAVKGVSCRPDFLALVYPWNLPDPTDPAKLRPDIRVDATLPPVFIAHAPDDKSAKVEGSLLLLLLLQANKIPAEAHLYSKGGHGFGLRPADAPCPSDWPERLHEWLRVMKLVP